MPMEAVIAALSGLLVGGGSIFLLRANRDRLESDTAATLTRSASDWINKLEERIEDLETRVRELEGERDHAHAATVEAERRGGRLQRLITILEAQVLERGGTPVRLEDIPE